MDTGTHWKKLTNPDYLGSYSFDDVVGAGANATIKKIVREEVFDPSKGRKDMCTIAHFKESLKPMILNKTNCKTIQEISGTPFIEKWTGYTVFIEVQKVKVKGEMVPALRLSAPKKGQAQKSTPPPNLPEEKPIHCEDCGDYVEGFSRGEETFTAQEVAEKTKATHGKVLCLDCSKRAAERKKVENSEGEDNKNDAD